MTFLTIVNGRKVVFQVELNELETMTAFERLGTSGKIVYLEFEPRLPREIIKARVYSDKESIGLKKFVSKI